MGRDRFVRKVGLLGGSFNPAHEGHLHLSREALKRLRLDEVWWLVSPHNPLKKQQELAPYAERLKEAKKIAAAEQKIQVSDVEQRRGLHYSIDTLNQLKCLYPQVQFVWLMGADNLIHFHRWKQWRKIFNLVPVAVFDRAPHLHPALHSQAALHFAPFRQKGRNLAQLAQLEPPAWGFAAMRRHPASATLLRKTLGKKPILGHTKAVGRS